MFHEPVLLKELIDNLNLKSGMTVIDGTLGAGGHSIAVLKKISPGGKLISIDWDRQVIENFEKRLRKEGYDITGGVNPAPVKSNNHDKIPLNIFRLIWRGNRIVCHWCGVNDNFANLDEIIRGLELGAVGAIFADLGFSSDQVEEAKRGFSFLKNGPLDMRYSQDLQKKTAADIVNGYSERELANIFWKYGEERYARKIAREIVRMRKIEGIRETGKLVEIISKAVPESYKRGRIHFATRVFQALRIEVNQELENLEIFLRRAVNILVKGGRLAIISFHSLEDRIVKNFFHKESQSCVCLPSFPRCVCKHKRNLKIITKKPIRPNEKEIHENPRARSARLRVAEKI